MPYVGRNLNIQWSSIDWVDPDGNPLPVKIELSRDSGGTWEDISASTADDGSFIWTVTGPASEDCLIRFSDPADPTVNFTSDLFFIRVFAGRPIALLSNTHVHCGV